MLTLEQCRESLAEAGDDLTNDQVLELRDAFASMARGIVESYQRQRQGRATAVDCEQ